MYVCCDGGGGGWAISLTCSGLVCVSSETGVTRELVIIVLVGGTTRTWANKLTLLRQDHTHRTLFYTNVHIIQSKETFKELHHAFSFIKYGI